MRSLKWAGSQTIFEQKVILLLLLCSHTKIRLILRITDLTDRDSGRCSSWRCPRPRCTGPWISCNSRSSEQGCIQKYFFMGGGGGIIPGCFFVGGGGWGGGGMQRSPTPTRIRHCVWSQLLVMIHIFKNQYLKKKVSNPVLVYSESVEKP